MVSARNGTTQVGWTILAGALAGQLTLMDAARGEPPAALRDALTFYASFDHGLDADLAEGDRRLYSAATLAGRGSGRPGLPDNAAVSLAKGAGRFGDALQFHRAAPEVVFYQVEKNLPYSKSNWSGTISFWLKLDPDADLPAGYCDPLFVTPRVYNDGALWADFSDKPPRQFRHGAFPDRKVWDPMLRDLDQTPEAERPLASVAKPPFSRASWTHIVMAFERFNTGEEDGVSTLYLNGEKAGRVGPREQTYTWELRQATAVMGINYVGLFDELAFFRRALTPAEVRVLYEASEGLASP